MRKLTYEEIKKYIENFGYKLLSNEYINSKTKLLVQCDKGHKYEVMFYNFQQGRRCPYCSKKHKYTYEEVKEYIEQFNYKLLSDEYINVNEPLLIQCDNKHEPYNVTFHNFQQGKRCHECAIISIHNKQKHSYEYVKKYIESFGYKLLSDEYINAYVKLLVKCPNSSHKPYDVTFHNFQRGTRCPYCKISKGEKRIIDWLEENDIEYVYEKTFKGLLGIGGGNLSYDFYLPKYNLLIEYQGIQHEKQSKSFGDLERQKEHDKRKKEYAENNGYKLLEIWYWDFDNIENILNKEIKN